ncbi:MAG TPA: hypothetical protein VFX16_10745 [Pseudonocardiaceae bacterium]|nr:hypothetical protein [Pseudonocardiaceae bacterium]
MSDALWSRRFLDALTTIGLGSTWLPRRRTTQVQLLSFSVAKSVVIATVQAPDGEPYRARIAMRAFGAGEWAQLQRAIAERTRYMAKLLSGELPLDIESVFDELDLPLLPRSSRDIAMDCSCPNWEVPCEHLVAVCGRLADAFDTDPFTVFAWRGCPRLELLDRLVSLRTAHQSRPATTRGSRSLAESMGVFWGSELPAPASPPPLAESVRQPDLVLDQVAPPDISVRGQPLVDALRPLYRIITGT